MLLEFNFAVESISTLDDEDTTNCIPLADCKSVVDLIKIYEADRLPLGITKAKVIQNLRTIKCGDELTSEGIRKISVLCPREESEAGDMFRMSAPRMSAPMTRSGR